MTLRYAVPLGAVALSLLTATAIQAQDGQNLIYPVGEDSRFHWSDLDRFQAMDLSGQQVTVLGPWLGPDRDLVNSMLDYFVAATGATVNFAGSDSFEQQIVIDIQAGSPPNLAVFPQPGLAANQAAKGGLVPLGDDTRQWVLDNYAAGQSWVDLGTYDGPDGNPEYYGFFYKVDLKNDGPDGNPEYYGFFYKVDLKSLVWYSPENFEDAGYEVPGSMEELIALSEQIVAEGGTTRCIVLCSCDASGLPATDLVEDMLLSTPVRSDFRPRYATRQASRAVPPLAS